MASCRLAIFFDWLLGDWNRCEDIVRLFGAFRVLVRRSYRPHFPTLRRLHSSAEPGFFIFLQCPAINTAPLITFLLDLMREFHPPFTAEIRNSIVQVMKIVRSKHQE